MRSKTLGWIVWGIATVVFVAVSTVTTLNGNLSGDLTFVPIALVAVFAYSVVGAILIAKDPRNSIGWLLASFGLLFSLSGLMSELTELLGRRDPNSSLVPLFGWIQQWLLAPALVPLALIIALFPDGRPASPAWRWVVWAAFLLGAVGAFGTVLDPAPISISDQIEVANPVGIDALRPVTSAAIAVWVLGLIVLFVAAVVSLVLRYRRARGDERQQIRWLAYVAVTAVAGFILVVVTQSLFGTGLLVDLSFVAFLAAVGLGIPVACGVAVTKYRLYDLDLVIRKTVVFGILVVLLMTVSIGFLLIGSTLVTGAATDETQAVGLAMLAIGFLVWPLWRLSRGIADRVVYGGRASPYEVLSGFAERVGETYAASDVLRRMARAIGEGTGAEATHIWLRVGRELRPEAAWPPDAPPSASVPFADPLPRSLSEGVAVEVRHRGAILGALAVTMPASDPMNPAKERLIRVLASQAGPVFENIRLVEDLRESRRRLVAAQDEERRRLERDIHDGVQQQLVALQVQLKLARNLVERDPAKAGQMLETLQGASGEALEDLRDLARGIYPPLLADKGLAAALESQARKAALPVSVEPDGIGRYPQEVEATVYFCCLEALNNVAKYAEASSAIVRLTQRDGSLTFVVSDDGVGFDPNDRGYGTGLQGMADRLEAIGGELTVEGEPGHGTKVSGTVRVGVGD